VHSPPYDTVKKAFAHRYLDAPMVLIYGPRKCGKSEAMRKYLDVHPMFGVAVNVNANAPVRDLQAAFNGGYDVPEGESLSQTVRNIFLPAVRLAKQKGDKTIVVVVDGIESILKNDPTAMRPLYDISELIPVVCIGSGQSPGDAVSQISHIGPRITYMPTSSSAPLRPEVKDQLIRYAAKKFYAGGRLSWLPIENGAILSEELAKFEESDLNKYPGGTFKVAEKAVGMLGANFQDYSLLIDDKTSTTLEDAHAKLVTSRYNFLWAIFRDQSVQLDERKKMLAVAERVASSVWSVQENRIAANPAVSVEMSRRELPLANALVRKNVLCPIIDRDFTIESASLAAAVFDLKKDNELEL